MHLRSILRPFLTSLLLLLLSSPAWAVILVLKDGQQMSVKKYERKGTRVIVVLTSGTMTEMAASEVDFEATEKINAAAGGGGGDMVFDLDDEPDAPPPPPDRSRSSRDLAGGGLVARPGASQQASDNDRQDLVKTAAGFIDLARLPRLPYDNAQALAEISQYLESQGVELFDVYAGSSGDRPLLVVQTESESVVFKVLKDAASAFIQTNARYPEVAALELLMEAPKGLGGQFVLTPDLAQPLATGRMSPQLFFIRYVQF